MVCNYYHCILCSKCFRMLAGLSMHFRKLHAERYHQGEAERGGKKKRWDDGMLVRLAREKVRLKKLGVKFINQELHRSFPEYTMEAIKGQRNKERYAEPIAEEERRLENFGSQPNQTAVGLTKEKEKLQKIKECINLFILMGREIVQSEVIAFKRVLLDSTLERLFPAVRQGGRRMNNNKTMEDLETLPKMQMLFRDPKKLMGCILQNSLDVRQTVPASAKDYWTDLPSRESPEVPKYEDRHERLSCLMDPISKEEVALFLSRKASWAPGLDGWTWKAINHKTKELTALYNLSMYYRSVPARNGRHRTV